MAPNIVPPRSKKRVRADVWNTYCSPPRSGGFTILRQVRRRKDGVWEQRSVMPGSKSKVLVLYLVVISAEMGKELYETAKHW